MDKASLSIEAILKSRDTDKVTDHSYGDFYKTLFAKYDRMDLLNILELGVQRGGSLDAWATYFPLANVYGVDLVDERLDRYRCRSDVHFFQEDLRQAVNRFNGPFDIIIDDSDHLADTMAFIATNYFPLLAADGTLVFEDVQEPASYLKRIVEAIQPFKDCVVSMHDFRHIKNRPDDVIITLTKTNENTTTFTAAPCELHLPRVDSQEG